MFHHECVHRIGFERIVAGNHLVEHHAKSVLVGSSLGSLTSDVFGSDVGRCSKNSAGCSHGFVGKSSNPEVGQHRVMSRIIDEHDVGGFDISVDHSDGVCILQRIGQLASDRNSISRAERTVLLVEVFTQRTAGKILDHHVGMFTGRVEIDHSGDVGMLQLSHCSGLALKPCREVMAVGEM